MESKSSDRVVGVLRERVFAQRRLDAHRIAVIRDAGFDELFLAVVTQAIETSGALWEDNLSADIDADLRHALTDIDREINLIERDDIDRAIASIESDESIGLSHAAACAHVGESAKALR